MRKLDAFLAVAVSVLASSGSAHAQDALAALGGAMPTERSRSSVTVVPLDRPAPAGEGATVTDAPPSGEVASDSLSALSGRLDTLDRAVSDVDLKVKDIDERLGRIEENRVKFDEIRKNQENTANALAGLLSQIDTLERRTRYAVRWVNRMGAGSPGPDEEAEIDGSWPEQNEPKSAATDSAPAPASASSSRPPDRPGYAVYYDRTRGYYYVPVRSSAAPPPARLVPTRTVLYAAPSPIPVRPSPPPQRFAQAAPRAAVGRRPGFG
jgi:hypothetical protein